MAKKKIYILNGDECCASLLNLYSIIVEKMGAVITNGTRFSCTKLHVTQGVMNQVMTYYETENLKDEERALLWLMYGPKADIESNMDYVVEVEEGFTVNE